MFVSSKSAVHLFVPEVAARAALVFEILGRSRDHKKGTHFFWAHNRAHGEIQFPEKIFRGILVCVFGGFGKNRAPKLGEKLQTRYQLAHTPKRHILKMGRGNARGSG